MENLLINTVIPFNTSWLDYPDNFSLSVIVNCTGCSHNCKNCQNDLLQDYNYDIDIKKFVLKEFIKNLRKTTNKYKTCKICLEGGDFLFSKNINFTKELLFQFGKEFDFCLYTGYGIDYVRENKIIGFKFVKCEKYNEGLRQPPEKTDNYIQFVSSNQKLYDENFNLISNKGKYFFNYGN